MSALMLKIAGGTGITPMLQVIDAILRDKEDNTKVCPMIWFCSDLLFTVCMLFTEVLLKQVYLIYGNISPEDILLKDKLDALATEHPNFKVLIKSFI